MKTKTVKEMVEVETTTYYCDHCTFEAYYEEDMQEHYGKEHAAKDHKTIEGREYYLFLEESDVNCWIDAKCNYSEYYSVEWKGPGWYTLIYDQRLCLRGCCMEDTNTFIEANSFIDSEIEETKSEMMKLESYLYKLNGTKKQIEENLKVEEDAS